MRVIGFNFSKISVEKLKDINQTPKITTSIDITEINEIKTALLNIKDEATMIQARFTYGVRYEPDFASIDLAGSVLLTLDSKEAKEVIKRWKKKEIPEGFRTILFNVVLRKAALKSLHLEEEMNLPLHIPLPTLRPGQGGQDAREGKGKGRKEK